MMNTQGTYDVQYDEHTPQNKGHETPTLWTNPKLQTRIAIPNPNSNPNPELELPLRPALKTCAAIPRLSNSVKSLE